jgi:hypothetical protein
MDCAKRCHKLAKRIRDPAIAKTLSERAKLLTQTAIEAERALALLDRTGNLKPRVVLSKAKTLAELRRDLQGLSAGVTLQLLIRDYTDLFFSPDQTGNAWSASRRLCEEFGCKAEFRPDGRISFRRRD